MLLIALALLAYPCGIERIVPVRGGVKLTFANRDPGAIWRGSERTRSVLTGDGPLTLRNGELLMITLPHHGCSMKLVTRNGKYGLEAYSWVAPAGGEGSGVETFIPVQRR